MCIDERLLDDYFDRRAAAILVRESAERKLAAAAAEMKRARTGEHPLLVCLRECKRRQAQLERIANAPVEAWREIRAPADGVVTSVVAVGSRVDAEHPMFGIETPSQLSAEVNIPAGYLWNLMPGLPVLVTLDDRPGTIYVGEVNRVTRHVDIQTRRFRALISLANPGQELHPDMPGTVSIVLGEISATHPADQTASDSLEREVPHAPVRDR